MTSEPPPKPPVRVWQCGNASGGAAGVDGGGWGGCGRGRGGHEEDAVQSLACGRPARRWRLNGTECPAVAGCIDVDLNWSPSTNLLPICRLGLAPGQEAGVRAAWLRFPSFTLEPLEQRYRRLDAATYRYESGGGAFV